MKKLHLLTIICFLTVSIRAQNDRNIDSFNQLPLDQKKELIIQELLQDTAKFVAADVSTKSSIKYNVDSYSELYIINRKQHFKFDIVEASCVEEFIQNYLRKPKIKSIEKLDKATSDAFFGTSGENGVTLIELKHLKKRKTTNCGFVKGSDHSGTNLN